MILPSFDHHVQEGILIGRIVVAFGELEVTTAINTGGVMGDMDLALKAIYTVRTTGGRLDVADVFARPKYTAAKLENEYLQARRAVKESLTIRNQYAHCQWGDDLDAGLFFTDIEAAAKRQKFEFEWRHIDELLLNRQLNYLDYALECLHYVAAEYRVRTGTLGRHAFPARPKLNPPPLHNPPSLHVPPWINEVEKKRHLALAREFEARERQPVRKPSVPKLTEAEWRAKASKEARQKKAKKK